MVKVSKMKRKNWFQTKTHQLKVWKMNFVPILFTRKTNVINYIFVFY